MSYQPARTNKRLKIHLVLHKQMCPYINPAPPVIMIFLTSGNGSNLVLPISIGASFQTPKSSKNLFCSSLAEEGAVKETN